MPWSIILMNADYPAGPKSRFWDRACTIRCWLGVEVERGTWPGGCEWHHGWYLIPWSEGEGGAAKVIWERMVGNLPLTLTSASNVEVIAKSEYYDEAEVLAELGRMEFEILPTECTDKNKQSKP